MYKDNFESGSEIDILLNDYAFYSWVDLGIFVILFILYV